MLSRVAFVVTLVLLACSVWAMANYLSGSQTTLQNNIGEVRAIYNYYDNNRNTMPIRDLTVVDKTTGVCNQAAGWTPVNLYNWAGSVTGLKNTDGTYTAATPGPNAANAVAAVGAIPAINFWKSGLLCELRVKNVVSPASGLVNKILQTVANPGWLTSHPGQTPKYVCPVNTAAYQYTPASICQCLQGPVGTAVTNDMLPISRVTYTTATNFNANTAAGKQFDASKNWRQSPSGAGLKWAQADGATVAPAATNQWTFGLQSKLETGTYLTDLTVAVGPTVCKDPELTQTKLTTTTTIQSLLNLNQTGCGDFGLDTSNSYQVDLQYTSQWQMDNRQKMNANAMGAFHALYTNTVTVPRSQVYLVARTRIQTTCDATCQAFRFGPNAELLLAAVNDVWAYMNCICWVAGIGGFFSLLGVVYIIAKKTRATQQEYFLVSVFALLLSVVLIILLWLMLSLVSDSYNTQRAYFTGKDACIVDDTWRRIPTALVADTNMANLHTWAAVFVGLLMVGVVGGIGVFVYVTKGLEQLGGLRNSQEFSNQF